MRNFNTFDKGLIIGLIIGISITLLLLGLMSDHGPLFPYTGDEIKKSDGSYEEEDENRDEDNDDDDDENDVEFSGIITEVACPFITVSTPSGVIDINTRDEDGEDADIEDEEFDRKITCEDLSVGDEVDIEETKLDASTGTVIAEEIEVNPDDDDEDEEYEILKDIYFDLDDLIPLIGIIISIGVLAFGAGSLINTLRKRNIEESVREDEKDKLIRRLELIEEALLGGRISEETYKELKAKYGEMLSKYKQ